MPQFQESMYGVGKIIRDLRRKRKLTGEELGAKAHMSQSKISKIETGFYAHLVPSEIESILNILDAPKTISQQVILAIQNDTAYYTAHHGRITPQWTDFATPLRREREAKLVRIFVFQIIPAILQTLEYRKALLEHYTHIDPRHDITMKRQVLLWDGHHTYHVILHETALYTILSSRAIHHAQLDRLERFIGAEYVKLGILPLRAGLAPFESSPFVLYDERLVVANTGSNEIEFDGLEDITMHIQMFAAIEKKACYGPEARELIHEAMDYFNQV